MHTVVWSNTMQRITLSTKTVETDDGEEEADNEFIEISSAVQKAVNERAMTENERFGDAFVSYLSEQLTDE